MKDATMTMTFNPTPEFEKILDELSVPKAEYVVESPITIEATTDSGEIMRYPTAIRERVVRCRHCAMYDAEDGMCMRDPEHTGRGWHAHPYGFCAWGSPRNGGE